MSDDILRATEPARLGAARAQAHRAAQLIAQAARANLAEEPSYRRTRLEWVAGDRKLTTQPIPAGDRGVVHLRLGLDPLHIDVLLNEEPALKSWASTRGLEATSVQTVATWLDEALRQLGLGPAAPFDPDDIPEDVVGLASFSAVEGAATLSTWYDLADRRLKEIKAIADADGVTPGADAATCWPHHFDIATYVQLAPGDPEHAPGVGVGLSPGDGYYAEPYFYVSPYPQPAPDALPPAPAPGHWRTDGFVALIATASELLPGDDVDGRLRHFLIDAFTLGRTLAER